MKQFNVKNIALAAMLMCSVSDAFAASAAAHKGRVGSGGSSSRQVQSVEQFGEGKNSYTSWACDHWKTLFAGCTAVAIAAFAVTATIYVEKIKNQLKKFKSAPRNNKAMQLRAELNNWVFLRNTSWVACAAVGGLAALGTAHHMTKQSKWATDNYNDTVLKRFGRLLFAHTAIDTRTEAAPAHEAPASSAKVLTAHRAESAPSREPHAPAPAHASTPAPAHEAPAVQATPVVSGPVDTHVSPQVAQPAEVLTDSVVKGAPAAPGTAPEAPAVVVLDHVDTHVSPQVAQPAEVLTDSVVNGAPAAPGTAPAPAPEAPAPSVLVPLIAPTPRGVPAPVPPAPVPPAPALRPAPAHTRASAPRGSLAKAPRAQTPAPAPAPASGTAPANNSVQAAPGSGI